MSCSTTNCIAVAVPGPPGTNATNGTNGSNGASAYGTIVDAFDMPGELDVTPPLEVLNSLGDASSAWLVVGSWLYVQSAGVMGVYSKPDATHVVLQNLTDTPNNAYLPPINAAATTPIPASQACAPTGPQGPPG